MKLDLAFLSRACLPFLLLAAPAAADTITGRVVDASGVGVAGVDIDVKSLSGGGNPNITNDGTDASGFFTTTLPAGVYRVFFYPPAPPTTTHLTATVDNVVVAGVKNMGVITLAPGVGIFGRALDAAGVPVAGVNLDVIDVPTATNLLLKGATTNAFGNFAVAAPAHSIYLDLDPLAVIGRTLAPRRLELVPTGELQLGNLTLQTGFALSGTLRNSAGVAQSGIDLDVFDTATGAAVFTPHDNTNTAGLFSMVLAPGTYDVEVCPPLARRLVATDVPGLAFTTTTSLGVITLASGVVLSGVVRDVTGTGVLGADVNVRNALTLVSVFLCGDNTSATGAYTVVVPVGTLNIGFALPGKHGTSGEDLHTHVPITGDTILDGVLPAPAPDFSATPRTGAGPLSVAFTDLSTGAITAWSWNFGDLATSTLPSPTHVYASPGTYTVELTLSGPGGPATNRKLGYVTVQVPAPVAAFIGSPTSGVVPLTVSFTNQSTGTITSHAWNFGDGGSSTLASPSHTYTAAGTYTVSLTETGPDGANTLTRVGYIVVSEVAPVAQFVGTPISGVLPLAVSFTNQSTGTITSHAWTFGDGGTSSLASPSHTYAASGTYTVSLTETGPSGVNTRTRVGYIVVSEPAPVAQFVGTPTSGVVPLVVSFANQSTGTITSHAWIFGDGGTSTLANPSHTYTASGTYTVSLTETGPSGTNTRTRVGYIVVSEPAPVAQFAGTPISGVVPLTVSFTNQSTGTITSHAWTFGDGGTSTLASPNHTYAASGTYTVSLTETGPSGVNTRTRVGYIVVSEPAPVAQFVGTPTSGVVPLVVSFTNQSTGTITSHAWTFGDGGTSTLASPSHTYTAAGTYTVSLTETGPNGTNTRTRAGYIVVSEAPPVAGFTASPRRGRALLTVAFQDQSIGAVTSWSWDFGDGTTSSARSPSHVYRFGGIHTVRLTVSGPGGSDQEIKLDYVVVRGPRR